MAKGTSNRKSPLENADAFLAYSGEHIKYEIDMFFWLAEACRPSSEKKIMVRPEDAQAIRYAMIEAFVIHLRNLTDFLYPRGSLQPTDVIAGDFLDAVSVSPLPDISDTLISARERADKEISHLTTSRRVGAPPDKEWQFAALAAEIRPLLD